MAPATHAFVDPRLADAEQVATAVLSPPAQVQAGIHLSVNHDIDSLEREWRRFEKEADCTAFQCFDWLATWQRHIGAPAGVLPAIVVGRASNGETLFILPLAVHSTGLIRRLSFLGRDLCDYNAPLLAPGFDQTYGRDFEQIWREIRHLLDNDRRYRHDVIVFDKMPARIGSQSNPFTQLPRTLNPSGAYRTSLSNDWEAFYAAKRSAATRRRDRSKRRRLGEYGAIQLTTPSSAKEAAQTLELLVEQKRRAFARMGVHDLFSRPGYLEFFYDLATQPIDRRLVHVSCLEVGSKVAATNLGIEFGGTYYHVLASYDDGPMSRFGPGAIHLQDLMRRALERGNATFDFTIGDEAYKRDWSDEELRLYDFLSSANARGMAVACFLNAARRLKRSIKQSRLWPLFMRLRSGIAGTKANPGVSDRDD